MKYASPSDFEPSLTEHMVSVFCKFPVPSIETLIRNVEERFHYEYNSLITRLLDTLELFVKEVGAKITSSCVFDDVSVVVSYDESIPVAKIKEKIARACYHFWQNYIAYTREGKAALES